MCEQFYNFRKRIFSKFLKFDSCRVHLKLMHDYTKLCRVQRFILAQNASKRQRKMKRSKTKRYIDYRCTYRYRIMGMAYSYTVVRDIQRICFSVRWSSWRIWSRTAGACHRIAGRSCELSLTKAPDTRAFKAHLTKLLITDRKRKDDYPDVVTYDCILQ